MTSRLLRSLTEPSSPGAATPTRAKAHPSRRPIRRPAEVSVRFVEVSHRVTAGMETYPGLPEPKVDVIIDYVTSRERYGGKAEFLIASLHLCGNTGTYVDSPHHRYPAGTDLAELPLERLAHLEVIVIDATGAVSYT